MEVEGLRERLHEYINDADEQHLIAIYAIVDDKDQASDIYTDELMNELYQRREDHRNGVSESYTGEESIRLIREYKKKQ
jgi:hypothetical protein